MKPLRLAARAQRGAGGPRPVPLLTVAVVAVCGLLWAGSPFAFPSRDHVPVVIVENHTGFPVTVAVRPAASGGWTGVGRVPATETRSFHEVPDAGKQWEVRFGYAGRASADVVVTRADLRAAGWHVVVPDELARQAEAAGLAPALPDLLQGSS